MLSRRKSPPKRRDTTQREKNNAAVPTDEIVDNVQPVNREITKLTTSTNLLIPKLPFARLVMGSELAEKLGVKQFDGKGYAEWSYRMLFVLEEKEMLDHVKSEPKETDFENVDWKKKDASAKSLIIRCIHDSMLEMTRSCKSAFDIWKLLQESFNRKSISRRLYLSMDLHHLRVENNEALSSFFLRFDRLIRELKDAGEDLKEVDIIVRLMILMPDTYQPVIAALETLDEADLTVMKVKTRLLEEESRMNRKKVIHLEEVFVDQAVAMPANNNYLNKNRNNVRNNEYQKKCYECGSNKHLRNKCPKLNRSNEKTEESASMAFDKSVGWSLLGTTCAKNQPNINDFVLDSGCIQHMVNNEDILQNVYELPEPTPISIAMEGALLYATKVGTVKGSIICNRGEEIVTLNDVAYVPELAHNLLSIKKLTSKGYKVVFDCNGARLCYHETIIGESLSKYGLEWMKIRVKLPGQANLVSNDVNLLWHRRLGHLSMKNVCKLVNENMATGIKDKLSVELPFCVDCARANSIRLRFTNTRRRASRPLENVHSDICGPISPEPYEGYSYFVSFIDDFTHMTIVYMMKRKSETFSKFKEFHAMATSHFNVKMSRLRIDNGTEYLSNEMINFCKNEGIMIDNVPPYTSQLNGVSERMNRTLMERVRAMLVDTNMDKALWPEALNAAVYLTNRSPTVSLTGSTPYEMWFSTKPNLSNLRVFGCQAFAVVPKGKRRKLDDKAREFIFVGYANGGYRLWDPKECKICISRDVKFNESQFGATIVDTNLIVDQDKIENDIKSDTSSESGGESEGTQYITPDEDDDDDTLTQNTTVSHSTPIVKVERKSKRTIQKPVWKTDDFEWDDSAMITNVVNDCPSEYDEIKNRSDAKYWNKAIENEVKSLLENNTWDVVKDPGNVKKIGSKWVFAMKADQNGNLTQHKARLVALGYMQKGGVDYSETYAPVARMSTIRILLAVSVKHEFFVNHLDVKTAFLNGLLEEEVYVKPPPGINVPENHILKLRKLLYGLKQSPRCWNKIFNEFVLKLGFKQSKSDYCLYSYIKERSVVYLVVYVDDILLCGNDNILLKLIKSKLSVEFQIKDLGEVRNFMNLNIVFDREQGLVKIDQKGYIERILKKFGMENCNNALTPMEVGLKLEKSDNAVKTRQPYRELIGSLMYAMLGTRPDICFALSYLARFQECAEDIHWIHLKRVLRYLKGTSSLGLVYEKNDRKPVLAAYADADYANDLETRKSTSGFLIQVYGNTILWCGKKQTNVTLSSCEAEYVAACGAACEIMWVYKIFGDLQLNVPLPIAMYEDSAGCIQIAKNPETKRSKHIDVKYHFIREQVNNGLIKLVKVSTNDQAADALTKALSKDLLGKHLNVLCLK